MASFQILEPHRDGTLQPMDGATYHDKAALFRALPYADYDAEVVAFDLGELRSSLTTSMRIVTEDVVVEAWSQLNRSEREGYAERDLFKLASRFVSDEYQAAVSAVEAVELARVA